MSDLSFPSPSMRDPLTSNASSGARPTARSTASAISFGSIWCLERNLIQSISHQPCLILNDGYLFSWNASLSLKLSSQPLESRLNHLLEHAKLNFTHFCL